MERGGSYGRGLSTDHDCSCVKGETEMFQSCLVKGTVAYLFLSCMCASPSIGDRIHSAIELRPFAIASTDRGLVHCRPNGEEWQILESNLPTGGTLYSIPHATEHFLYSIQSRRHAELWFCEIINEKVSSLSFGKERGLVSLVVDATGMVVALFRSRNILVGVRSIVKEKQLVLKPAKAGVMFSRV